MRSLPYRDDAKAVKGTELMKIGRPWMLYILTTL
jgi:hypothetical protein